MIAIAETLSRPTYTCEFKDLNWERLKPPGIRYQPRKGENPPRAHGRTPPLYLADPADNPSLGRALPHRCDILRRIEA